MDGSSVTVYLFREETVTVWFTKFCHRCLFPGGNEPRRKNLEAKQFPSVHGIALYNLENEDKARGFHKEIHLLYRFMQFIAGRGVLKILHGCALRLTRTLYVLPSARHGINMTDFYM
jgi:hypothetical protein